MKIICVGFLVIFSLSFAEAQSKVPVPTTGCYHSAFTPNSPTQGAYGHADFEALAGKKIAIEMFYVGWATNRVPDFPVATCNAIVALGSIPHLTWEPWASGSPYPLDGILNGSYDSYLAGYAAQVKNWGKPLFIRMGHEMNGNWYPWCGATNGGATTNGFGDTAKADGPERFIAAYRHVHHVFDSVGVTNVSWVWALNNFSVPNEIWNAPEAFYPGDDVVDWIGYDGYNWGTSQSWSSWTNFIDVFKDVYTRFKSYAKPKMWAEFASAEVGGDKGQWIRDTFLYTHLYFTQIKAMTWFNINKETDWRMNSGVRAETAYQQSVADEYFLGAVPTTDIKTPRPSIGEIRLHPVYPNPSNGAVQISFAVPLMSDCALTIKNVLGQDVSVVVQGSLTAGEHTVSWDTRDRKGAAVPSGMYFAVLEDGGVRRVQKVLIMK